MAFTIKKCSMMLHKLSDAVVRSDGRPEQSLPQASADAVEVKSEEARAPSPLLFMKDEPEDEVMYDVSVKNELCSEHVKLEDGYLQEERVLFEDENSAGVSAREEASRDAPGGAHVSGASSSKQRSRCTFSQRGLLAIGAAHLQRHIHLTRQPTRAGPAAERPSKRSPIKLTRTHQKDRRKQLLLGQSSAKPHRCSICGDYNSVSKANLKRHILHKHSSDKPYRCSECNYACVEKGTLSRHIHSKHSSDKPFRCSDCDYACVEKGNLKQHILRKHSSDKPYRCSYCDFACVRKDALKKHVRSKHALVNAPCGSV